MGYLDEKEKRFIKSIELINSGILGIILASTLLFYSTQYFSIYSVDTWAITVALFAFFSILVIYGLLQLRTREVYFKNDHRTKIMIRFELFLNTLAFIIMGIGGVIADYNEGNTKPLLFHPYTVQGAVLFLAGVGILGLTKYLYNRFIPKQLLKEVEGKNTQTISLQ